MRFFQESFVHPDLFLADKALQGELKRRLPGETLSGVTDRFEALGKATTSELVELQTEAEAHEPEHVPYDPWGRRVDEIKVAPAWDKLKAFSARHGIVATAYDDGLGDRARVAQAALIHLFSATSAIFSCPLAMTDAAARVLKESEVASVRDRLFPRLTTFEPGDFITSGQWMTERTGGSDVGGTETVARPLGDEGGEDKYALNGVKWFTSATTSEMALTLARIDDGKAPVVDGSRGLTMFCVELERDARGALDGIIVNRLKDKLGTRALPTAELTLDGVKATRLSEVGRGVPSIATMLNITRLHNALAASSHMARATYLARDYATRRVAFGKKLIDHRLHARTLEAMEAETAGALAICFEVADLLGKLEHGAASEEEQQRLRALIPIAKLTTGKQTVRVVSEGLEAFGGAGYVEDTGIPRILRDAQVLSIWEGTTNVLSLDVLRAEAKSGSFSAVVKDLVARAESLDSSLGGAHLDAVMSGLGRLSLVMKERSADGPAAFEPIARDLALNTGYLAEAILLGESAAHADGGEVRFADFVRARIAPPLALL